MTREFLLGEKLCKKNPFMIKQNFYIVGMLISFRKRFFIPWKNIYKIYFRIYILELYRQNHIYASIEFHSQKRDKCANALKAIELFLLLLFK